MRDDGLASPLSGASREAGSARHRSAFLFPWDLARYTWLYLKITVHAGAVWEWAELQTIRCLWDRKYAESLAVERTPSGEATASGEANKNALSGYDAMHASEKIVGAEANSWADQQARTYRAKP